MSTVQPAAGSAVVIDTNIALDLLLFDDPAVQPLRESLDRGHLVWLATAPMREELARVLGYPHLRRRFGRTATAPSDVLAGFDARARVVEAPLRAAISCRDADDQKFVDLAVARACLLLSKDQDLLSMKKRLTRFQVTAGARLTAQAGPRVSA